MCVYISCILESEFFAQLTRLRFICSKTHVDTHTDTYIYEHTHILTHTRTHAHKHTHTITNTHTQKHTHTHIYIYIYVCVCVCMYISTSLVCWFFSYLSIYLSIYHILCHYEIGVKDNFTFSSFLSFPSLSLSPPFLSLYFFSLHTHIHT